MGHTPTADRGPPTHPNIGVLNGSVSHYNPEPARSSRDLEASDAEVPPAEGPGGAVLELEQVTPSEWCLIWGLVGLLSAALFLSTTSLRV